MLSRAREQAVAEVFHEPANERLNGPESNFAPESNYAFSQTALRKSGPFGAACLESVAVTGRLRLGFGGNAGPTALYSDLLEGSYDCVDRVVLNAYFGMGQTGGGLRVWWRALYGSDENLNDTHLMRAPGRAL